MWVPSLGQEDPLEEGMATHSSILAWRIPMDREAWWAALHGVPKSRTRLKRLSVRAFPTPSVYLTAVTVQDLAMWLPRARLQCWSFSRSKYCLGC